MARIRQDDVEAVRERTDIVRLVGEYVSLKKAGRDLSGLCPFHSEKTPSFTVSAEKGMYYCFGCGKGGDAIRFVRDIESLEFPEAVERLARAAGITLRYEGEGREQRKAASRRQALYRANARASELYHRVLLDGREGEAARRYLQGRGVSQGSVERFGIGFAPGYPDFLLRRLARELSPEILSEAGLTLQDGSGGIRDRFRSRILFPVRDLSGRVAGFGARLLQGDGPKYLNSPETPVYRKGEMLYNLDRAKAAIGREELAYVVEGYTDVLALDQGGLEVAVATCGTALTEEHFRLLSRFLRGGAAVLAFDSDEAGARAAERAYGLFEGFPMEVRVLILPEGLDPADLVTQRGAEAFRAAAEAAQPLVEYMLRRALRGADLSAPEGRSRAVQSVMPIVAGLEDPVRRDQYAGMLADLTGTSPSSVLLELERAAPAAERSRGGRGGRPEPAARTARTARTPTRELEKEALKLLAQQPDACGGMVAAITEDHFETEVFRRAFSILRDRPGRAAVIERGEEAGIGELIARLSVEPLTGEPTEEYAGQVFSRLQELFLGRRIATMKKQLERLNPTKDPRAYDSLFEELIALESRRREVRAQAGEGA